MKHLFIRFKNTILLSVATVGLTGTAMAFGDQEMYPIPPDTSCTVTCSFYTCECK